MAYIETDIMFDLDELLEYTRVFFQIHADPFLGAKPIAHEVLGTIYYCRTKSTQLTAWAAYWYWSMALEGWTRHTSMRSAYMERMKKLCVKFGQPVPTLTDLAPILAFQAMPDRNTYIHNAALELEHCIDKVSKMKEYFQLVM